MGMLWSSGNLGCFEDSCWIMSVMHWERDNTDIPCNALRFSLFDLIAETCLWNKQFIWGSRVVRKNRTDLQHYMTASRLTCVQQAGPVFWCNQLGCQKKTYIDKMLGQSRCWSYAWAVPCHNPSFTIESVGLTKLKLNFTSAKIHKTRRILNWLSKGRRHSPGQWPSPLKSWKCVSFDQFWYSALMPSSHLAKFCGL